MNENAAVERWLWSSKEKEYFDDGLIERVFRRGQRVALAPQR
ncbi:hypothetical protein [Rhodococcus sp. NPDC060176]